MPGGCLGWGLEMEFSLLSTWRVSLTVTRGNWVITVGCGVTSRDLGSQCDRFSF